MELPDHLSLDKLATALAGKSLLISDDARNRVAVNRAYLDGMLSRGNTHYGINTGFGSLCNVRIKDDELSQLQENLVCSHACGMGDEVPQDIVRLMLLLKVHACSWPGLSPTAIS